MRRSVPILAFLLFFLCSYAFPQELSYTRYTPHNGLPGATVYQAVQDSNGYIWFATSQGISRFDGRTFRNFSKEDGLPDNDILKLYLDRNNNIWSVSLAGIPSVIYGRSGMVRKFENCPGVYRISENYRGDSIIFHADTYTGMDRYFFFYHSANKQGRWSFAPTNKNTGPAARAMYVDFSTPGISTIFRFNRLLISRYHLTVIDGRHNSEYTFPFNENNGSFQQGIKSLFTYSHVRQSFLFLTDSLYEASSSGLKMLFSLQSLQLRYIDVNYIFHENDSTLWLCTRSKGLLQVKNFRSPNRQVRYLFPDAFCTSIIKDREGAFWVTTHNQGVYHVQGLQYYHIPGTGDIRSMIVTPQQIIAGKTDGKMLVVDKQTMKATPLAIYNSSGSDLNNRILDIQPYKQGSLLIVNDLHLQILTKDHTLKELVYYGGIKGCHVVSDSLILLATSEGLRFKRPDDNGTGLLFGTRATCVNALGDQYWWGTPNGLYYVQQGVIRKYPGVESSVNHIDIAPDSTIWVSTQQGVAVIRKGQLTMIGKAEGLLSNMCKHVLPDGETAWVATDKGLSRVSYHRSHNGPAYTIFNITEQDGLISPDVNQTAICGSDLAVATDRGLCFIPRNDRLPPPPPPLINISTVMGGDNEPITGDTVSIDYKKNKLFITLAGISFRSGKDIRYLYRLRDADTSWTSSASGQIEFAALPFGTHLFEADVVDRWGKRSGQVKQLVIRVPPPYWKTNWFIWSTYCLTALLVGGAVYAVARVQQRRKDTMYQFRKRTADMELMALKAQINPHFIFNCLGSIQHYIMDADIKNANAYLHKFSVLMRKILQQSAVNDISLPEEIGILTLYLDLEKLRLGNRMEYSINVAPGLRPEDHYIPPMIIQPYVENAVKHGVAGLQNRQGYIQVGFCQEANYLVCTIDDNGHGRSRTEREGGGPSGSRINASRINVINSMLKEKISLEIIDKKEQGTGEGTIVRLCFPVTNNLL
ncbi:sensor histidine kinase [Chitinophaga vietnamensis]|uniref:sensor histidine kinase n=1 Tax=Chitinophaga vietnamensis TaxID=2593957 RepID=UPI001177337B|nr:histidine kinase [Chitinophaga vietnamensis]